MAELHRDQCRLLPREGGLRNDNLGRPLARASPGWPAPSFSPQSRSPSLEAGSHSTTVWWLVAYFALVGGLSQLILGAGQFALGEGSTGRRVLARQLALWNLGAVLVPIGVPARAPGVVAVGSIVLLAALAPFAAATSVPPRRGARDHRCWLKAYRAVAIFLAGSVTVGSGLADALPWQ